MLHVRTISKYFYGKGEKMTVKDRLLEEIARLGYEKKSWLKAVNISEKAQYNYENGERLPKTEYWQAAAELGMDIQYVITGVYSNCTFVQKTELDSKNLLDTIEITLKNSKEQVSNMERILKIANEITKKAGS